MLGLGLGVDKIRPSGVLPLLDLYPATAAYSLRALSSSTTNVVKVREDGLNQEQDFTAKEIIDGTLATFCGGNNGFVVTWYDQAGSNDATQATAGSQPKIVSSGSVITENSLPALDFDGVDDFFNLTNGISATSDEISLASVVFFNNTATRTIVGAANGIVGAPHVRADISTLDVLRNRATQLATVTGISVNVEHSVFVSTNSSTVSISIDGNNSNTSVSPLFSNPLASIGFSSNGEYFQSKMKEVIIYNTDQSSNRTAIESNINSHYSIYP